MIKSKPFDFGNHLKKYGIDGTLKGEFSKKYLPEISISTEVLDYILNLWYIEKIRRPMRYNILKLVRNFNGDVTCGQIDDMLEWVSTHPKDSCSLGYFKTFYPNYEEEFKKKCLKTSVSLESFILRDGEREGRRKYEEANRKKYLSLQNFVLKYGEEEGVKRWEGLCERNKGNHSLERKIELYGEEEGVEKYEQSRQNLKNKQSLENFKKIYGEEEGVERHRSMCKKHSDYAKSQPNPVWKIGTPNYYKWLEVIHSKPKLPINYELLEAKKIYYKQVALFTRRVNLSSLKNSEKRGRSDLSGQAYHLDHKISVSFGFKHKIPPEIIGSPENLQFLPFTENSSKRDSCWSSLDSRPIWDVSKSEYFSFLEEFRYD